MDVVRVTALEEFEPETWRWNVHLPKGQRYHWDAAYGDIPASGVPRARVTAVSNEPYWETGLDAVMTAALRRRSDGNWLLTVGSRSLNTKWQIGGLSVPIPDSALRPMLDAGNIEQETLGDHRTTETLPPAKPIILLKRRVWEQPPPGNRPLTKATPGIMIWLQPQGIIDVDPQTIEAEMVPPQPKSAAPPPAVGIPAESPPSMPDEAKHPIVEVIGLLASARSPLYRFSSPYSPVRPTCGSRWTRRPEVWLPWLGPPSTT